MGYYITDEKHAQRLEIWRSMSAQGATWDAMSKAAGVKARSFQEWARRYCEGAKTYRAKRNHTPSADLVCLRIRARVRDGDPQWRIAKAVGMSVGELRLYACLHKIDLTPPADARLLTGEERARARQIAAQRKRPDDDLIADMEPAAAPYRLRACLGCGDPVKSTGPGHRMCNSCRYRVSSPFEPDFGRSNARRAASHRV